jgi:hypothetical protein
VSHAVASLERIRNRIHELDPMVWGGKGADLPFQHVTPPGGHGERVLELRRERVHPSWLFGSRIWMGAPLVRVEAPSFLARPKGWIHDHRGSEQPTEETDPKEGANSAPVTMAVSISHDI